MPSAAFNLFIVLSALYLTVICRSSPAVRGAAAAENPSSFTRSVPLCAQEGDTVKNINGTTYSIFCGTDFSRGDQQDLEVTPQADLEDCLIQCSKYNQQVPRSSSETCKGVVHTNQSLCYLKNAFEDQAAVSGRNSAFFFDSAPLGTNCLQDDKQLYMEEKYGDEYQILCKTELRDGIRLDSFNGTYLTDCMARCSEITRGDDAGPCLGVTLKDGICWLRGGSYVKSDTSPYAMDSAIFTKRNWAVQ